MFNKCSLSAQFLPSSEQNSKGDKAEQGALGSQLCPGGSADAQATEIRLVNAPVYVHEITMGI